MLFSFSPQPRFISCLQPFFPAAKRFDFRRIDSERICERIQYIAGKEGLTVTDGAASLIAAAADGGMRDALSILDLCASGSKNIDEETVESVCGMAGGDYLLQLAD